MTRALLALLLLTAACSHPQTEPVSQNPPIVSAAAVDAWLATGAYLNWHCEAAPHPAVSPSSHEINRACANDLAASTGTGPVPVDAAWVKESYDPSGTTIVGYSMQRHTRDGTTGDTWFWYRKVALTDTTLPHDDGGVVAIGWALDGTAADDICVGCHQNAGAPGFLGRDFVFDLTQ